MVQAILWYLGMAMIIGWLFFVVVTHVARWHQVLDHDIDDLIFEKGARDEKGNIRYVAGMEQIDWDKMDALGRRNWHQIMNGQVRQRTAEVFGRRAS